MDIIDIFWDNVIFYKESEGLTWKAIMGGNITRVGENITTRKVQDIAEILNIDDYSILFENNLEE